MSDKKAPMEEPAEGTPAAIASRMLAVFCANMREIGIPNKDILWGLKMMTEVIEEHVEADKKPPVYDHPASDVFEAIDRAMAAIGAQKVQCDCPVCVARRSAYNMAHPGQSPT